MPPILETDEEKNKKLVEESVRKALEESSKKTTELIDEKLNKTQSGSKVSQILKNAGVGQQTTQVQTDEQIEKDRLEKERLESEKTKHHNHEDVYCPTCSVKEHTHILKEAGNGKLKCEGDGCGTIYNLIPDNADYKCDGCGLPKKLPNTTKITEGKKVIESTSDDSCPFCSGNKFHKYDWNKLKNITKK